MGETAESVLMSFRVSAEKLTNTGFQFLYPDTESSLKALYK
jgi:NAD dependent epimerase/dehydratase family enzyme